MTRTSPVPAPLATRVRRRLAAATTAVVLLLGALAAPAATAAGGTAGDEEISAADMVVLPTLDLQVRPGETALVPVHHDGEAFSPEPSAFLLGVPGGFEVTAVEHDCASDGNFEVIPDFLGFVAWTSADCRWDGSDDGTTYTVHLAVPDGLAPGTYRGEYIASRSNDVGDAIAHRAVDLTVSDTDEPLVTITAPVGDQLAGWVDFTGTGPAGATVIWSLTEEGSGAAGSSSSVSVDSEGTWRHQKKFVAGDTVWRLTVWVSGDPATAVSTTFRIREAEPIDIVTPGSGSVHASGPVTLTGTAHPSSLLRPVVGDVEQPAVEVGADGGWSTTVDLTRGRYTVTVRYESLAGTSASVDLVVWDEGVTITEVGGQDAADGVVVTPPGTGAIGVTGTGFPGRTVTVDGRAVGGDVGDSATAVVDDDGRWQVSLAGDLEDLRWRDVVLVARDEGGSETRVAAVVAWPILIAAPAGGTIVPVGTDLTLEVRGFSWVAHEVLVDGEVVQTVPQQGSSTTFTTVLGAEVLHPGANTLTVRQPELPDHTASVTVGVVTVGAVDLRVDARVRRVESRTELKEILP